MKISLFCARTTIHFDDNDNDDDADHPVILLMNCTLALDEPKPAIDRQTQNIHIQTKAQVSESALADNSKRKMLATEF